MLSDSCKVKLLFKLTHLNLNITNFVKSMAYFLINIGTYDGVLYGVKVMKDNPTEAT